MDAHGCIDVLHETEWDNVLISSNDHPELIGASLNALLKAMFLLFAKESNLLPGNEEVWIEAVDHIYLCLLKLCKIEDLLMRVDALFSLVMGGVVMGGEDGRNHSSSQDVMAVRSGSVLFLIYLIKHYRIYMLDSDSIKLYLFALSLDQRCQIAPQFRPQRHHTTDLLVLARNLLNPSSLPDVNLPFMRGTWDGVSAVNSSSTARLKEELAKKGSSFKLEIFGGDMFMDEVSSSDSDNDDDEEKDKRGEVGEEEEVFEVPRILTGRFLLDDPSILGRDLLHQFDLLEIARQWTLVDHYLFQNISIRQLLSSTSSSSSSVDVSELQGNGGAKRFIERFNLASSWLTSCILNQLTPETRVEELGRLLDLAQYFVDLNNYHGLMAVLAAVQQGAVSRLRITFDLLPAEQHEKLQKLKTLMSGERNYVRYREEVSRILQQCPTPRREWKKDVPAAAPLQGSEKEIKAMVPHLGAHLAALAAIGECHGDYLTEYAHLFNLMKWRLCHGVTEPLSRLQALRYPFRPVRVVAAALHCAWKSFQSPSQTSGSLARNFFLQSEQLESTAAIERYFQAKHQKMMPPLPPTRSPADPRGLPSHSKAMSFRNEEDDEEKDDDGEKDDDDEEEGDDEEEEDESSDEEESLSKTKGKGKLHKLMKIIRGISIR
eukprot:gene6900-7622_t